MTIIKQISFFDIQQLFKIESSHRFDTILATFDIQPTFHFFSKKTLRGVHQNLLKKRGEATEETWT
ncbi:hypothetical protein [Klebsiella pneumoniae]|uniref:hypothetical protein n=1 Tax=Klebsiella pneumoniae TaxID=573 RepID=UPI00376FF9BD